MTLLSHKLFDHCDILLETSESPSEMVEAPHVNPSSGLPLIKNSSIDIGGYVIGDGPLAHEDSASLSEVDASIDIFESPLEMECFSDSVSLIDCDDFISDDLCSFDDDWL
jgi:hypothetical protein